MLKTLLSLAFLVLSPPQFKAFTQPGFLHSDSHPQPPCRWTGSICPNQNQEDTEHFLKNITNVLRKNTRSGEDLRTSRFQKLFKVIHQGTDQQILSLINTLKKHPYFVTPKILQAFFEKVNKIKRNNLSFYSHKIIPALKSFREFENFLHTSLQSSIKKPRHQERITSLAKKENLARLGVFEDIYGDRSKAKKLKNKIQTDIKKTFEVSDMSKRLNLTRETNKLKSAALLVGGQLSNSFILPFIKQSLEETHKMSLSSANRSFIKMRNSAIQAAGDSLLKAGYLDNKYNTLKTGDLTKLSDIIFHEGNYPQTLRPSSVQLARQVAEKIKNTKAKKYLNESGLFYGVMQAPSIQAALKSNRKGDSSVSRYNTQFAPDQDFKPRTTLVKERLKNLFKKESDEFKRLQGYKLLTEAGGICQYFGKRRFRR